jgi:cytidylate kinase
MPIIIISSDSAQTAEKIATSTAKAMDYQCIGPELLSEIATQCQLPADKMTESLGVSKSSWRRMRPKRRAQLLSCIEAEVLDRLKVDNVVCWGMGAHLYVQGVSHALKVRLLIDEEQHVKEVARQRNISVKKAAKWLQGEMRKKEQWSQSAYGQNELDPAMYDLVINLGNIDPDEAVRTISGAVAYRKFKPMTYSIKNLEGIAMAAEVKAKLLETMSDVRVQARDGRVVVTSKALKREKRKKAAAIKEIAGKVDGVEFVEVHLINYVIREAAESYR